MNVCNNEVGVILLLYALSTNEHHEKNNIDPSNSNFDKRHFIGVSLTIFHNDSNLLDVIAETIEKKKNIHQIQLSKKRYFAYN